MDGTVGERIGRLREMAGLKGRETDRLVGVAECYTRLIESGERGKSLTLEVAGRYALTFGVSLDWLLTGKGPSPTRQTVVAAVNAKKKAA